MVFQHVEHFQERHRPVFRLFRLLTGVLLALIIWDPVPGMLTGIMNNDVAIVTLFVCLFTLTLVVSYDFLTRTQRSWLQLIQKYFFLMVCIILLFGTMYLFLQTRTADSGLRSPYRYTPERDVYYYSATTYFTVGFGDYTPYGAAKTLSVFEAALGNIVTVVVLAIALTRFNGWQQKTSQNKVRTQAAPTTKTKK